MSHYKGSKLGFVREVETHIAYYTVDCTKIDATLSNFPVGIKIEKSTGFFDGLSYSDWQKLHATVDGEECYVEIEKWDFSYGNEEAVLWVRVPSVLATANTTIKIEIGENNNVRLISSQETIDDFTGTNGDEPNYSLWESVETDCDFNIQSNALKSSHNSNQNTSKRSKFVLSGDFDIQIDFNIETGPSTSTWAFQFHATALNAYSDDLIFIDRRYSSGSKYYSTAKIGGSDYNAETSTSDTSGKLRIVRTGSTVYTYYYNSGWQQLHTRSGFTTSDLYILLRSVTTSSMTFSASFDNLFVNSCDGISGYVGQTGDFGAQAVWDENFVGVYHHAQDPSGGTDCILDSTSNKNHGTPDSTMTSSDLVDGELGYAIDFDGSDDWINIIDVATDMAAASEFSWEFFGSSDLSGTSQMPIAANTSSGTNSLLLFIISTGAVGFTNNSLSDINSPTGLVSSDETIYLALDFDGNNYNIVLNDVSVRQYTTTSNLLSSSDTWQIGMEYDSSSEGNFLNGKVEEVRLSKVKRSRAWKKATKHVLNNTLLTYSATEPTYPSLYYTVDHTLIDSSLSDFPIGINIRHVDFFVGLGSDSWKQIHASISGSDRYTEVVTWEPENSFATIWVLAPAIPSSVDLVIEIGIGEPDDIYCECIQNHNVALSSQSLKQIEFDPTGSTLFTVSSYTDRFYWWPLSTAWDISSMGSVSYASIPTNTVGLGFRFVDDGDQIIFYGTGPVELVRCTTTTNYGISGLSEQENNTSITNIAGGPVFNSDYSEMLIRNYKFSFTTPLDLSTLSNDGTWHTESFLNVHYSSDGYRIYAIRSDEYTIAMMELSTAYDTDTVGEIFDLFTVDSDIYEVLRGIYVREHDGVADIYLNEGTYQSEHKYLAYRVNISSKVGLTGQYPAKKVWDEDFTGVYHMAQDPSGGTDCILDSTRYENHGTPQGSMTSDDLIGAGFGKAIEFDGSDDGIIVTDDDSLDVTSDYSIECSYLKATGQAVGGLVDKLQSSSPYYGYTLIYDTNTLGGGSSYNYTAKFFTKGAVGTANWDSIGTGLVGEQWYYTVLNPTEAYHDGAFSVTRDYPCDPAITTANLKIGVSYNNDFFAGSISEARVSKVTRSAAWIKATNAVLKETLLSLSFTSPLNDEYAVISEIGFSDTIVGLRIIERTFLATLGFSDDTREDNTLYAWKYFGNLQNGDEDPVGTVGSPTLSDYWATFDGNDGYYYNNLADESTDDYAIVFRIEEDLFRTSDTPSIIWKSGGTTHAVELLLARHSTDHQPFIYHKRMNSTTVYSREMNVQNLEKNVWYEAFLTSTDLAIVEYNNPTTGWIISGSAINAGDATGNESVGFCDSDGGATLSSQGGYFTGSVREIKYYRDGAINIPSGLVDELLVLGQYFGSEHDGTCSPINVVGTVNQGTNYVILNGSGNGLAWSDSFSEIDCSDVRVVFRLQEDFDLLFNYHTIWKSGGSGNGIEFGIWRRSIGFAIRSNSSLTSNLINIYNLEENVWYEAFMSSSKMTIRELSTPANGFTQSETLTPCTSNGTADICVGYISDQGPLSGASSANSQYTEVDVSEVEVYDNDGLTFPSDLDTPEYGPIYRFNFGSNYGGYYSNWYAISLATVNSDNLEFNGSSAKLWSTSDYWDESEDLGIIAIVSFDDLSSDQTIWKSGGSTNGLGIGIDSGNIGIFGRASGSSSSITVSTSSLSTSTDYIIFANKSKFAIYTYPALELVADNTGTVSSANGADDESVGYARGSSPITGIASDGDYFDGRIYQIDIWVGDEITFPETNWYHAESEIGFADVIVGEVNTAIMYTSETIGFNEQIGGEIISVQKYFSSTFGLDDYISADHITEEDKQSGPHTIGFGDEIDARLSTRNVGQTSALGFDDTIDGYNSFFYVGQTSQIGFDEEIGGKNQITTIGFSSTFGLSDSVSENITQEGSISSEIGLDDTIGEISIRNVGFSSQIGFNGISLGGNPFSPDNLNEIGFDETIGVDYFPVKGFADILGFSDQVRTVRQYFFGFEDTIGFDDSSHAFNAGSLLEIIPSNMTFKFFVTLTGSQDGLDDFELTEIKQIDLKLKQTESSYLGVSIIYSEEKEDEIDARLNGTLLLEMANYCGGEEISREEFMEVNLSDVKYKKDAPARDKTIILTGYGTINFYTTDVVYLDDATSKTEYASGKINYEFAQPNFDIRPGWHIAYGIERFWADEVHFSVGNNRFRMNIYTPEVEGDNGVRGPMEIEGEGGIEVDIDGNGLDGIVEVNVDEKAGEDSTASITVKYTDDNMDLIENGGDITVTVDGNELITMNLSNVEFSFNRDNEITLLGQQKIDFTKGDTYIPYQIMVARIGQSDDIYLKSIDPNVNIKPLSTIRYRGREFLAGGVSFKYRGHRKSMEIIDTANIDAEFSFSDSVGFDDLVVCNSIYPDNNVESELGINGSPHASLNGVENACYDTSEIGFTAYIGYELNP